MAIEALVRGRIPCYSLSPMIHVFRLGPIDIDGQSVFVYGGFSEKGLLAPEIANTDTDGLGALAKAAQGQPLRCEPAGVKSSAWRSTMSPARSKRLRAWWRKDE